MQARGHLAIAAAVMSIVHWL